jgi:hypothetical protein
MARRRPPNPNATPRKIRDGDRRRRTRIDLARAAIERKQRAADWTIDQPGAQDLPETDPRGT